MITDLLYPPGASFNNSIDSQLCTLTYIMVDVVTQVAAKLGRGSLLAEANIESANTSFQSTLMTGHFWGYIGVAANSDLW